MFEEKMSGSQLLDEYHADLEDIQFQTLQFDRSAYISDLLKKCKGQKQVIITGSSSSSRGNAYLTILIYDCLGNGKENAWSLTSFNIGLMNTAKGICAISFYEKSKSVVKFTAHFFRRYKQRFKRICEQQIRTQLEQLESIVDIVLFYMKRNLSMTWIETGAVYSHIVHIFCPVSDGVALLQWDKRKKLLQANTFITMDMLDKKQNKIANYAIIYSAFSEEQKKQFGLPDFATNDKTSGI